MKSAATSCDCSHLHSRHLPVVEPSVHFHIPRLSTQPFHRHRANRSPSIQAAALARTPPARFLASCSKEPRASKPPAQEPWPMSAPCCSTVDVRLIGLLNWPSAQRDPFRFTCVKLRDRLQTPLYACSFDSISSRDSHRCQCYIFSTANKSPTDPSTKTTESNINMRDQSFRRATLLLFRCPDPSRGEGRQLTNPRRQKRQT